MPRVLIALPLPKELRAFAAALTEAGVRTHPVEARVEAIEAPALGVLLAASGHGKAQFALTCQHLVEQHGPFEALVVAGASGALSPVLAPGDVVIGTEAVEHDYRTRFHGEGPPPRHVASEELVEAITAAAEAARVHVGPIASGDEDIVEADRARALHASTGALCVAWEGAGGARVAAFNGLPFVEARAVTDRADAEAAGSYRVHLTEAVGNVARALLPWLRARVA
ncbi:MAG: 5'-methylthioadenosine/S-adenosylhomocysteine nucleosidase [Bacteroidota bacterium]